MEKTRGGQNLERTQVLSRLGFLVVLISPGNGNGSLAQGAIWASEESLSTWFDRENQCELGALRGPGQRGELMARAKGGAPEDGFASPLHVFG